MAFLINQNFLKVVTTWSITAGQFMFWFWDITHSKVVQSWCIIAPKTPWIILSVAPFSLFWYWTIYCKRILSPEVFIEVIFTNLLRMVVLKVTIIFFSVGLHKWYNSIANFLSGPFIVTCSPCFLTCPI